MMDGFRIKREEQGTNEVPVKTHAFNKNAAGPGVAIVFLAKVPGWGVGML